MLLLAFACWLCDLLVPGLYWQAFAKPDAAAANADFGRGLRVHDTAADIVVLAALRFLIFCPYYLNTRGWLGRVLCCFRSCLARKPQHATRCAVLLHMLWGMANVVLISVKMVLFSTQIGSFTQWRAPQARARLLWVLLCLSLGSSCIQMLLLRRLNRGSNSVEEDDILETLLVKHLKRFLRQATSPVQLLLRLYAHEPGAISEMDKIYAEAPGDFEFYIPQLVTFLLSGSSQKESFLLRHFLLDKCGRSHIFAHKMHWFLVSFCATMLHKGEDQGNGQSGGDSGQGKTKKGKRSRRASKHQLEQQFMLQLLEEVETKGCIAIMRELAEDGEDFGVGAGAGQLHSNAGVGDRGSPR